MTESPILFAINSQNNKSLQKFNIGARQSTLKHVMSHLVEIFYVFTFPTRIKTGKVIFTSSKAGSSGRIKSIGFISCLSK